MPREVYEAIVDYLRAAGRVEGMRAEAYIFAPLADALRKGASGKAEDWDERRYVGHKQIWRTLKRYGRLAGIADEKLTLQALRHTATMLRVQAGDGLEEIQEFLQRPPQKFIKSYLKALQPPEANTEGLRDVENAPPQFLERDPYRNKPWGGMIHGMAARCQPPEEVAAVLAEDIQGMEEEIVGVRLLNRALLEMQNWTSDPMEVALLTDAYSRAAMRLSKMFETEEAMNKRRPEEDGPEQFLASLAEGAKERGQVLDIEREKALALGGEEALAANARRLAEEIAGMRVALRRTFQRAMESETARRRAYLTDVYGRGCRRLVKLLSLDGDNQTRLKIYVNRVIDEVILGIQDEWGLK